MPLAKHEAQIRKLSPSRIPSSPALLPEGEGRKRASRKNTSAADRYIHQHFRTLARATIYFQRAANPHRPFLHADQAKVFGLAIRRSLIIKTMPVVSHA